MEDYHKKMEIAMNWYNIVEYKEATMMRFFNMAEPRYRVSTLHVVRGHGTYSYEDGEPT